MEVSSPGRICLFGEHQDYLGLPVIAMAMNLRLQIRGRKRNDKKIIILHKLTFEFLLFFDLLKE